MGNEPPALKPHFAVAPTWERLAPELLDTLPYVVWASSADMRQLLYLNPAAESVYGRPRSDFLDDPGLWHDVVHADDRRKLGAALGELPNRGSFDLEYRIHRPDGEVRWLSDHTQVRFDEAQNPACIYAVRRDVTERRRSEETIRRSGRLAAIGTLATGIAHEINNPVGAALLAAETAMTIQDMPEHRELLGLSLQNVVDSLYRCSSIVKNILRFARDEPREKVLGDLNRIVRQARDLTREYADRNGAVIEADLDEDLPPIPVSPIEIEQAIINLLHNAIQAGEPGSLVRIRTRHSGKLAFVTVEDSGRGMTEEEQQHAFDPFFTTRQSVGGTGLGMSIIFGIVQDHGGSIRIHSELGKGTAITIELPIPDETSPRPDA